MALFGFILGSNYILFYLWLIIIINYVTVPNITEIKQDLLKIKDRLCCDLCVLVVFVLLD